ncbi:MAG: tetratricopeptide repeat protein [Myxococcota bacterium]
MATRKLEDIHYNRQPPPESVSAAKEAGATISPYNPQRLAQFVAGEITLGDLEGISKADQYKMAETGYRLLSSGKFDDAKKVFLGLHALDPFDAYFLASLGVIAVQQGDHDEGRARFSRALEINPYSAAALVGRAELLLADGALPEAASDLARAIAADPEGKDPTTQRARAIAANVKRLIEQAQKAS